MDDETKAPLIRRSSSENIPIVGIRTYKRRWFMLLLFSLNNFVSGILFMGLSPINDVAAKYYNVSMSSIQWLSNAFIIMYPFFAFPAAYFLIRFGVRPILSLSAGLQAVTGFLHYFGSRSDRYWCVVAGQVFGGIAYSGLIQLPSQISAIWFPENERATATSIGTFMNILGLVVAFLQTSQMVPATSINSKVKDGLENLFLTQLIFYVIMFLLTMIGYRERPPTPPTNINEQERQMPFTDAIKKLMKNKNFLMCSQAFGFYYGLILVYSVMLNSIVTSVYPVGYEKKIGWMGVSNLLLSIVSTFLIGLVLDKLHLYRVAGILLNGFSALLWLLFVIVLTETGNFTVLFVVFTLFGSVAIPFFATGIEQAAEISYPIPEIIPSTILLFFGNLYGFAFLLVLGMLPHGKTVGYIVFALYFISAIWAFLTKSELNRKNAEDKASREKH